MDRHLLRFRLRQRVLGFKVPDAPWFDSHETTEWFLDRLANAKRYLEFGSGGSTYVAAKLGIDFIAVDSDVYFLKAVRKKIQRDGYARPTGQAFHYADIGPTGLWGRPVGDIPPQRLQKFRKYSDPPAACFDGAMLPDLVLVDGRFRVACAMKAMRMLRDEQDWTIVVDDYAGRPALHVLEDYATLEHLVGRMAVFKPPRQPELAALDEQITCFEVLRD